MPTTVKTKTDLPGPDDAPYNDDYYNIDRAAASWYAMLERYRK